MSATLPIVPGMFGPNGYGSMDGREGMFTARGYEIPLAYGALARGLFGPNGYGADTSPWQQPAPCGIGVWVAPSACSSSDWTSPGDCAPGIWSPVSFAT